MGSSTSKPRKKPKNKPQHLPKVGTPANLEWRHEGERQDAFGVFGGKTMAIVLGVMVVAALIGLLFITA